MLLTAALALLAPQSPAVAQRPPAARGAPVRIALQPAGEDSPVRLRWSPKGATVPLVLEGDALVGEFPLGPDGTPPVRVRLGRSHGSEHHDRLWLDRDRDGRLADDELLTTTPTERRGKWWSSFATVVDVPVPATADRPAGSRPYPMALWFVFDPREPEQAPALRWSRRGCHVGRAELGGAEALVLLTESRMDGVFGPDDAWQLGRQPDDLARNSSPLTGHCWLDGTAWRVTDCDPHGRQLTVEPFDPGLSEAEERERQDTMRPDREAPRAAVPLAFGHDLAAALAQAKEQGRKVFVDFETTWCGPCKMMDRFVYTAAAVVDAAAEQQLLCVKLDGDEQRELVAKYGVKGYPTMLLLDGEGDVLAREVGYRSVVQMVAFFSQ